jgi:regulator of protease activity HflC (stomatin/prohibitin superfamily)
VYDVTSIRTLPLTARQQHQRPVNLWTDNVRETSTGDIEPFLVGASLAQSAVHRAEAEADVTSTSVDNGSSVDKPTEAVSETEASVTSSYSLVDAEIVLQYRIQSQNNGLIDYLSFSSETPIRGRDLTEREMAIRTISLSQISEHLSKMPLEYVISPGRTNLLSDLRNRIQSALDDPQVRAGVEIIAVALPMIRPADMQASQFEELGISVQARLQNIAQAQSKLLGDVAYLLGDSNLVDPTLAAIDDWNAAEREFGQTSPQAIEARQKVERLLAQGGGAAAQSIEAGETDRWIALMNARSRASELLGQLPAYRASPELYKQLRMMEVFSNGLPGLNKYVIGIDPSQVNVQMDLKEINPLLDFSGAINKETTP